MARGSSYGEKPTLREPAKISIPKRATRELSVVRGEEEDPRTEALPTPRQRATSTAIPIYEVTEHPLARHRSWIYPITISTVCAVILILVLLSAGAFQRTGDPQIVPFQGGQTFPIQVGGSLGNVTQWVNSSGPVPAKTAVPTHTGPYSVLGPPTSTADFINQVLAAYNSPAAGKGQALYNYGVEYGIDPVYALAFFMHESEFGTTGVARVTLSLGNLRCIPDRNCLNTNDGGYAIMNSWEDGFEQWYKLIRNLYVAQWGLVTVDQIIPVYAPSSDHNDVAEYVAALKHIVDTWHAGTLRP
jgi:hypothetical protein